MVSKIFAHKNIRNKISIRYLHYNGQLEGRQWHTFHICQKIWITQPQIGLNNNYRTFIEFQPTVSLIISSGGGFPGLDGETPHLSYSTFHILTSGGFPHFSRGNPPGGFPIFQGKPPGGFPGGFPPGRTRRSILYATLPYCIKVYSYHTELQKL